MNGASSLFRVFDLAFFLPGSLILVGAWQGEVFKDFAVATRVGQPAYTTVMAALIGILLAFMGGVLCHLAIRLPQVVYWSGKEKEPTWRAWYTAELDEGPYAMAQYFWYMRATFANLAVAAPVAALLYARSAVAVGLGIVACALFSLLSLDYARALKNLTLTTPAKKPDQS